MVEIVLNDDQADALRKAAGEVILRDRHGSRLGSARTCVFTPEEIAEREQRLETDGPWRTTKEVLDRLSD